jgi:hypothetical protein
MVVWLPQCSARRGPSKRAATGLSSFQIEAAPKPTRTLGHIPQAIAMGLSKIDAAAVVDDGQVDTRVRDLDSDLDS